jgi:hypothetical protein
VAFPEGAADREAEAGGEADEFLDEQAGLNLGPQDDQNRLIR